jgi:hypothetical protein
MLNKMVPVAVQDVIIWCLCLLGVHLMLARYNAELRLSTLRWAVLGLLKQPPPGLEELVMQHFR